MIYLELLITFMKIGAFTFGGGYAMFPLIQQEVVEKGWLTQEKILDFVAISESTPGPLAVNMSTFVGMQLAGVLGAFCATLGVVLPSFVIIILVAKMFERFQSSRIVNGVLTGLRGAVVGLIGSSVILTAISVYKAPISNKNMYELVAGVLLLVGLLLGLKKINPILIIVISAFVGIIINM